MPSKRKGTGIRRDVSSILTKEGESKCEQVIQLLWLRTFFFFKVLKKKKSNTFISGSKLSKVVIHRLGYL